MTSYVLRDIEPTLWKKFKQRASAEGHSLRWVIVSLIKKYITDGL
jgi:hypothetical protein